MEKHIRYNTLADNKDLSPDMRMTLAPYRSIRQACISEGVQQTVLGQLIHGKKFRGWQAAGERISRHFGLLPQDAFPRYDWETPTVENAELACRIGKADRQFLASVIVTLTQREADVLRLHFGFEGEPMTLPQIAATYNVSCVRIRQILAKALRKLRHPSRLKLLEELR